MKLTRRTLIGTGIAGAAASALSLPTGIQRRGRRPKNIIFCVVDGMAMQTLTMADQLRQMTEGKSSYWAWLMQQDYVRTGLQDTRSLNSLVTDSAAASSTWGSGQHVWNGQLNEYPDGTQLRTLTQLMSAAGVRCGLVTTTTMTHATPAGFAVNCSQRDLEGLIAERYLTSGVDVLLGGGNRFFAADRRADKKDLYAEYQKAGYRVVKNRVDLMSGKSSKLLGIFSDSHLPFTLDRDQDPELQKTVPTLAEMTKVALEALQGSRNGFLLQIEGGKVDHAGHANDVAGLLYDQIAFEAAVKEAVDFAQKDGETLVIITADHATGGPSLNGAGAEYIDSTDGLRRVASMKSTYTPLLAAIGAGANADKIRDVVKTKLGIEFTGAEATAMVEALGGKFAFGMSEFQRSAGATLAMLLGNHTKVTWTSGNHTSDHVLLSALGPGSEFVGGVTPNVSLFNVMLAAKGLKHTNPTMSFADARKHYDAKRGKQDEEARALYAAPDEEECLCHR